ncbi:hypothetical protein SDC9_57050 [bioreactor metagenome]|uniref:Uncharacterized protein n=1 Tax=bioreactor metagenome TaxID=1076179 RepID=A0A644X3L4_9ZZZZ
MRFTTSEEAGNPHSHFVGVSKYAFFIAREKVCKMLLQFSRDNIFLKLLFDIGFIILSNLNDTLNISVYWFCEHLLNDHTLSPQSTSLKAL